MEHEKQHFQSHCQGLEKKVKNVEAECRCKQEELKLVKQELMQEKEELKNVASHWNERWLDVSMTLQSTQAELEETKQRQQEVDAVSTAPLCLHSTVFHQQYFHNQ